MSKGVPRTLGSAAKVANDFIDRFINKKAQIAGSIRRLKPKVKDIDMLTLENLTSIYPRLEDAGIPVLLGGNEVMHVRYKGFIINLYRAESSYWGAMLMFLTGPSQYNIAYRKRAKNMGWKLNQYGLYDSRGKMVAGKTEESIYEALGKEWKAPHLRGI